MSHRHYHKSNMRRHAGRRTPEREMSSYTFQSATSMDMSETNLTNWRYKSHWNDDECLSQQLEQILNPDLDTNNTEKNIISMLEKLTRSEKDMTYKGYALQHTLDEIVYVITNFLIKKNKRTTDHEKAIRKFKKNFSAPSDLSTWLVQHEYALIYDSEKFDLKECIGHENESHFWLTLQKLIIKYFQIEIEIQKAPIINWPSVWSQHFKQALSRKLKEISPDKIIDINHNGINDRFDEANLHHSNNKTAENWYKEFLCTRDHRMDTKQKLAFIRQTKRVCDGCGHSIKTSKSEIKPVIVYNGGWPSEEMFIFHDENCVKVRKYCESIRHFVFDVDMYLVKHRRLSAAMNWQKLLRLIQNRDYVLSVKQKIPRPLKPVWENEMDSEENMKYRTNFIPKSESATFRRKRKLAQYHLQIELIQTINFLNGNTAIKNHNLLPTDIYNENVDFQLVYGLTEISIPKIIRFMDIPQFGPSLFVFCLRSLEVKDRYGLWIIIQFIMAHLPTSSSISLLQRHKNELLRFPKDNLNKICLKIIQSSQFPIATSLYLCGYMSSCFTLSGNIECDKYASLYTKIAIDLCLFIESDHLLAILLEIPSDISELSILDICIQYKLVDFLYSHRLRPIFNQMWTQFKYLDPSKSFEMKTDSYLQIFNRLRLHPCAFYYSPQGLFITQVFYYILYIIIFSVWLIELSYPYHLPVTTLELILWLFNAGYLVQECMEVIYKKNAYLAHFSKYWDILIVLNWIIIACIRWPWAWLTWDAYIIYYPDSTEINENETKNQPLTIAYMICVGLQSILIWTRTILFLQRSTKTGPLIHTIFRLISDVWQFTILLALFLMGCMFALYYIIGSDSEDETESDGWYLLLYMLQALVGQQDWDLLKADDDHGFGVARSKWSQALMVFFSIIGNVALLNLMIALMASVYENNAPLTAKQVNYSSILNTIELVEKEALLPSPFNLIVLLGLSVYFILELFIYFISCSRYSYNITRVGWTNYSLNRDWVSIESKEMEQLLLNKKMSLSTPLSTDIKIGNNINTKRNAQYSSINKNNISDSDSEDSNEEKKYNNSINSNHSFLSNKDEEMLVKYEEQRAMINSNYAFWQKKEFHSVKCDNLKFLSQQKLYCRFCRNRMRQIGDIKIYFFLFRHYKALDESDKILLTNLLMTNRILCPSCFRPIKFYNSHKYNGDSTRLWRWQVSMEIISFYVFIIVGYLPILFFLFIPMLFELLIHRFNEWTNDTETNAKYKQQSRLNGNNVIFGGGNSEDNEYKHISATIHSQYYNFIKSEENNGNNGILLPHSNQQSMKHSNSQNHGQTLMNNGNINGNAADVSFHGLHQINEEIQTNPIKPVQSKLISKKMYSNEMLSPVIDSPLPTNQSMLINGNNNMGIIPNNANYKDVLMALTDIKKELSVLKKYTKMKANSKRRDSKNLLHNRRKAASNKLLKTKLLNNHSNSDGKEKELSVPSMPSIPSSLQTTNLTLQTTNHSSQNNIYGNNNNNQNLNISKPNITMKPSQMQLTMNQRSPRRQQSVASNEEIYDQQSLHDIIDDMSINSIMTATTVNHIK